MKQNLFRLAGVIIIILFTLNGCKKDDPEPDPVVVLLSPGKQITSFKIVTPAVTGVIDTTNKTIALSVPANTAVTGLVTEISIASGHTISPASGAAQNFTNPVVYSVKRPNGQTTAWTATVTVASSSITVDQDITQSITWTADKLYIINSEIEINNNSVLTIQPGTVIKFGANGSLSVGYSSNATILANGTAASPITFTSSALLPAAGAWKGLTFYDNTLNNSSLSYCNIQYAGNSATYGAVNLLGCDMAINHCNITNSGSFGIYTTFSNNLGGFVTFADNTISNTVKFGIVINAQKVSTIGTGNTFTNIKGISVFGDYKSSTVQTWKNLNAPYVVAEELDIDGNLTIEPGTTFKFESNGWIEIGYYDATTFIADGGAAATPITFTSNATSPVAGAWKGIVVNDNVQTNSKFNYCVIDYAGTSPTNMGALLMSGTSSIGFTNNIIRNSAGYGINMAYDAGFETFTNNTITNCANHLIVISTKHLPDLGSPNTLTAAAAKGILVSGNFNYDSPVTWKKQTADFYVSGEADVDGDVTIEAGCKFLFINNAFFWFGYYANTKVTAVGTSTAKIVFTSATANPIAGTWKGLYFDDNVMINSALTYCQFQYSGMDAKPAIYVNSSFPVNNTSITNFSSTHAAEYKTGITAPAGTGNDFTWFAN